MFKDNPAYKHEGNFNGISVYTLHKATDYHTLRYIEALNQQTFASCGTTKDKLNAIADELIRLCNEEKPRTIITDVAAIAQVLKYSLKYPVDEHCTVKVGCTLSFIEYEVDGHLYSEDPNKLDDVFMKKKMDLALNNPEAYTFFFGWGIANIPEYREHFDISTASDYFSKRTEVIASLLPKSLKHLIS